MRIALLGALLALPLVTLADAEQKPLVIHEWGTFTSLQDENGRTIGGVNIDDEPVPAFVHRLGERPKDAPITAEFFAGKSYYPGSPSVTMRLETPVMYFYPADDKPVSIDITATFKGGLVSEYFPNGETFLNGKPNKRSPEVIRGDGVGAITWKNVTINAKGEMPKTDEHVWVAPRKVASAPISVGDETEQYIFYRGVGNLNAPLTVRRQADMLNISPAKSFNSGAMWLADFRADGTCAFRDASIGDNSAAFSDYSTENVAKLRASMKTSLVSAGLFDDEAEAMLETWKLSYFKSSGQRLFYMVPQTWTDEVLPLTMSKQAQVTRVMIGRLELVTPEQRVVVNKIAGETDQATRKQLTASLGRFGQSLVGDDYRRREAARRTAATQPVAAVK